MSKYKNTTGNSVEISYYTNAEHYTNPAHECECEPKVLTIDSDSLFIFDETELNGNEIESQCQEKGLTKIS